MKKACLLFSLLIFSSACSPSQAAVQTASAQTQMADPTRTPTHTATPIPSSTVTPTSTPTPTFTPTPDLRVIDVDPEGLILQLGDLPADANYHLVGTRSRGKTSNSAILIKMGAGPGQEYIDRFGRVVGWYIDLTRGSFFTSTAPEFVGSGVTLFRTHEGAMKYFGETQPECQAPQDGTATKMESSIGDASLACLSTFLDLSGRTRLSYGVDFVYRNVYEYVYGSNWVDELNTEDVDLLVDLLMSRLQEAQLSDQVSVAP